MAECIEFGERFSTLLFLQISDFFDIVPGGFLFERTLYPCALLSDDSEAGTVYGRGFVVADCVHYDKLSRYLAPESDRPERLPNVCGSSFIGIGRKPDL